MELPTFSQEVAFHDACIGPGRKIANARRYFTCFVEVQNRFVPMPDHELMDSVQEIYDTNPTIRDACNASISGHAATLEGDIAQAMKLYGVAGVFTAQSLALHTQAVLQGAFILAKAKGGADVAISSVDHLRRYIELLFNAQQNKGQTKGRTKS